MFRLLETRFSYAQVVSGIVLPIDFVTSFALFDTYVISRQHFPANPRGHQPCHVMSGLLPLIMCILLLEGCPGRGLLA